MTRFGGFDGRDTQDLVRKQGEMPVNHKVASL
jgi:hypothetical protein